jgi:hypothetical protein
MQLPQETGLSTDVVLRDSHPWMNVPMRLSINGATHPGWGGRSSAALDTALNILVHAGLAPDSAADLHDQFVSDFLFRVPQEGGTLAHHEINAWIALQLGCTHPSFEFRGGGNRAPEGLDVRNAGSREFDFCTACGCGKQMLERRARGAFRRRVYRPW